MVYCIIVVIALNTWNKSAACYTPVHAVECLLVIIRKLSILANTLSSNTDFNWLCNPLIHVTVASSIGISVLDKYPNDFSRIVVMKGINIASL